MRDRKTLIILLLGFIFGISGAAYLNDKDRTSRKPSSISGINSKVPLLPPGGKSISLVKVEAQVPSYIPESKDEEVTLVARVLVNQGVGKELSYSWNLPEGVKVVSGQIKDRLAFVKPGQIVELKLTVKGFSREAQTLISVQASTELGGAILGNSAVFVSRPEETWESVAPAMARDAEEQLGESASPKARR